jgi:hypothetical protein
VTTISARSVISPPGRLEDYLLLLDAQAVIGESDWLDELLNHALRPEVAMVGARLLDPAGVIVRPV